VTSADHQRISVNGDAAQFVDSPNVDEASRRERSKVERDEQIRRARDWSALLVAQDLQRVTHRCRASNIQ